jgi:hypothetical protein
MLIRFATVLAVVLTQFGDQLVAAEPAPASAKAAASDKPVEPAPAAKAAQPTLLTADETRTLMRRLAEYVVEHHLKRDDSPQRGMTYEYYRPASAGKVDQYVQGEALDTMHDGCWFALAMINACRATGLPQDAQPRRRAI